MRACTVNLYDDTSIRNGCNATHTTFAAALWIRTDKIEKPCHHHSAKQRNDDEEVKKTSPTSITK